MIKKLRIKFVCITMVLMTLLMTVILALVYNSTAQSMESAAITAMQTAIQQDLQPGPPGAFGSGTTVPCFVLLQTPAGELIAFGESYDLSDEELLAQIYAAASGSGKQSGTLKQYALRFLRIDTPVVSRYVFTDMSAEIQTLNRLLVNCILVGIVSILGLLAISILLARWAVKPVERAWQQQRQFVADASHELKTPLTVILTNAELLQSGEYDESARSRFADSILTMSRQMRHLVEGMLDLARAENGSTQTQMSRLDFSGLISNVVLPFEPVYFEQGLTLLTQIQPDIYVNGFESHLRQMAEILLDNAQKYSAPGGTVTLTLEKLNRSHCRLAVESQGKELTAQQCRDIFKRFYRVDTARSGGKGHGLGLSIALRIVEEHRGKIRAEGRNGINTFFVTLPL